MRMTNWCAAALALTIVPGAAHAAEKDAPPAPPEVVRQLVDCRAIADSGQRLACYDQKVAALDAAAQSRDIVITDKAEVKKARRGLFGFKLPSLKIFGGDESDDEEVSEIESTIASARQLRTGEWRVVLQDGAVWEQSGTDRLVFDPRPGNPIRIKRGVLGSFKASIDGQPVVKMRRVE